LVAVSDEIENKPAIKAKPQKKVPVKKKREKKNGLLTKPQIVSNRFVFRDQLTANKYDLVKEILKNVALLKDPQTRLNYQMRLLPFAYNELEAVQALQPIDPSREGKNDSNTIDAEFVDTKDSSNFDLIMRRI
jgi:hypothetical protein